MPSKIKTDRWLFPWADPRHHVYLLPLLPHRRLLQQTKGANLQPFFPPQSWWESQIPLQVSTQWQFNPIVTHFCRRIELGRKSRFYQLSLILSRELDKKRRETEFTDGLVRMLGMVRTYFGEWSIEKLCCTMYSSSWSLSARGFFCSATCPAWRWGEFVQWHHFYSNFPSTQTETAELCPGCDCPMEETTDYRLVLTGQEIVVQICKDCNKQPNE